ncbi:NUDIX hydrolase [Patescibacteria group bacterium]|nr:NUDIX hydrolase [Patescibacteria group bacterium]
MNIINTSPHTLLRINEIFVAKKELLSSGFKFGVGLILRNPVGDILVHQELMSKPWLGKEIGDYSIPMETIELGETVQSCLNRLLFEEVGEDVVIALHPTKQILWYNILNKGIVVIFQARFICASNLEPAEKGEILPAGWMSPTKLLNQKMRVGVREIIQNYLGNTGITTREYNIIQINQ